MTINGMQLIHDVIGGPVGEDRELGQQTLEISETRFNHPRFGFPIILIDTPGFDFSDENDEYTKFKELLEWFRAKYVPSLTRTISTDRSLVVSYDSKTKLDGIIYMHNIWNQEAYRREPLSDCEELEALCGQDWHKKVILVNSHWSERIANDGEEREKKLKSLYWKTMLKKGSSMIRYESPGDRRRALEILERVIQV